MPKRKCSNVDVSFGANIAAYRKMCGFTQQQVADMLNLNRTTYTKYETGVSEPSIEIMKKIANIFGVDVNALLGIEPFEKALADFEMPIYSLTKDEQDLVGIYRLLSVEEKQRVMELLVKIKNDINDPYK